MPTALAVDLSLSMSRRLCFLDEPTEWTRLKLAARCICTILDTLAAESKSEHMCLVSFSKSYELVCPFTTNYELIKSKLSNLEEKSISSFENVLAGINRLVLTRWGMSVPCQVIILTDSDSGSDWTASATIPLPFSFHGRLSIISIAPEEESITALCKVVELSGHNGKILRPAASLSFADFNRILKDFIMDIYRPFIATLNCGHLSAFVNVYPAPMEYSKPVNRQIYLRNISKELQICGFLPSSDTGTPPYISRHVLIPMSSVFSGNIKQTPTTKSGSKHIKLEQSETRIPSFAVLLYLTLKKKRRVALCKLREDWYGIIYTGKDIPTNRSFLKLIILFPGPRPVPWLGKLNYLGILPPGVKPRDKDQFPVKPKEKRSYNQNLVVWIKHAGLQADVAKILRQARKLPEKTNSFYKELNRVRRAALSFGFVELLEGLADIFDRECTLLPATAHPDCALQLTHAAGILRKSVATDPKYIIQPMKTKFLSELDSAAASTSSART